jgi:hypothetical protein
MEKIFFNLCGVNELKKCNDGLTGLQDKIILLSDGSLKPDDIAVSDLRAIAEAKFIINELSRCMKEAGNEI